MNWNYSIGTTEFIFILSFIGLYVLYTIRTFRIAGKFQAQPRTLFVKFVVRALAFVLLLISLAGPFFGEAERKLLAEGKDIYLVVDLSRSMDATDVAPSRLEKLKYEVSRFTERLTNNRIGLIVFSENAFVQSPLTYDTEALQFLIQSLETGRMPDQGTDLCSALQLAVQKMSGGASLNKTKIILLLSDGEGNTDCGGELFNNIRRFDFRVFLVGVGTLNGSSIPVGEGVLKKQNGEIVISKLDEAALQRMTDLTNGSYFRISNERSETDKLIAEIGQLQGHLIDTRSVAVTSNKYYYFLGFALILLVLDVLITVRTFRV